jgi:hypothetical protein
MERIHDIFIPFIDWDVNKKTIEKVLLSQNFGQIMEIKTHEKKIKQNGKLKSAHHKYAFIKIYIFNTVQGNNLLENLETDKTTHVMFHNFNETVELDIKPYLSLKERSKKGFDLHVKDFRYSFYDDLNEKQECLNDYLELEKEVNKYYVASNL